MANLQEPLLGEVKKNSELDSSRETMLEIKIRDEHKLTCGKFSGHLDEITCLIVTSDGKKVISGSKDRLIKVWSIENVKSEYTLQGHTIGIHCLSVSQDGNLLASGSIDGKVKLWNLQGRKEEKEFPEKISCILSVWILKEYVAIVDHPNKVSLWNINTNEIIEINDARNKISRITRELFCPSDDPNEHQEVLNLYTEKVTYLWLLKEKRMYSSYLNELGLGYNQKNFYDPLQYTLASCDGNNVVCIYNLISKDFLGSIKLKYPFTSMCLSADSKSVFVATNSDEFYFEIWKATSEKLPENVQNIEKEMKIVVMDSKKNNFIGVDKVQDKLESTQSALIFGKMNSNDEIVEIPLERVKVYSLAIDPLNKFFVVGLSNSCIQVWDYEKKELSFTLEGHSAAVYSVIISEDSETIVSGSSDLLIKVWSVKNKSLECLFEGHSKSVVSLAMTRDKQFIISGSGDNEVRIWNVANEFILSGHTKAVRCVRITPNEKFIISSSADGSIKVWNFETRREEFTLLGHSSSVESIVISSDNRYVCSFAVDGSVYTWNLSERRKEFTIRSENEPYHIDIANDLCNIITFQRKSGIFQWKMMNAISNDMSINGWSPQSHDDPYFQDQEKFNSVLSALKYDSYANLTTEEFEIVFGQYGYTVIHFLVANEKSEVLERMLKGKDIKLKTDNFGKSPFYYSSKMCKKCTDIMLDALIGLSNKSSQFEESLYAIRNDLSLIISDSSKNLHEFLRCIFLKSDSRMHKIDKALPFYFFNEFSRPLPNEYCSEGPSAEWLSVTIETSALPLPCDKRSKQNREMLLAISLCQNDEVFRTKIIQNFVNDQWNMIKKLISLYTFVLFTNIVLLLLLISNGIQTWSLLIPFILTNAFLMAWEIAQIVISGWNYFRETLNILDQIRGILTIIWVILELCYFHSSYLTFAVALANLLRGLTGFTLFDGTRQYIRLIVQSLFEIKYFLVMFVYSTFCFGVLFSISDNLPISFTSLWINPYGLSFGGEISSDETNFKLYYIVYLAATLVNVVLMLNLLISILGDSHDQFQLDKVIIDLREKVELIIEIHKIVYWSESDSTLKYMHTCQSVFEESGSENWEGKLRFMDKRWTFVMDSLATLNRKIDAKNELKPFALNNAQGVDTPRRASPYEFNRRSRPISHESQTREDARSEKMGEMTRAEPEIIRGSQQAIDVANRREAILRPVVASQVSRDAYGKREAILNDINETSHGFQAGRKAIMNEGQVLLNNSESQNFRGFDYNQRIFYEVQEHIMEEVYDLEQITRVEEQNAIECSRQRDLINMKIKQTQKNLMEINEYKEKGEGFDENGFLSNKLTNAHELTPDEIMNAVSKLELLAKEDLKDLQIKLTGIIDELEASSEKIKIITIKRDAIMATKINLDNKIFQKSREETGVGEIQFETDEKIFQLRERENQHKLRSEYLQDLLKDLKQEIVMYGSEFENLLNETKNNEQQIQEFLEKTKMTHEKCQLLSKLNSLIEKCRLNQNLEESELIDFSLQEKASLSSDILLSELIDLKLRIREEIGDLIKSTIEMNGKSYENTKKFEEMENFQNILAQLTLESENILKEIDHIGKENEEIQKEITKITKRTNLEMIEEEEND